MMYENIIIINIYRTVSHLCDGLNHIAYCSKLLKRKGLQCEFSKIYHEFNDTTVKSRLKVGTVIFSLLKTVYFN